MQIPQVLKSFYERNDKLVLNTFAVFGAYYAIKYASSILSTIKQEVFTNRDLAKRYGEGSWAVITGGSDGIGEEFCKQLARLGFKICILARNEEKLKNVCSQLEVETKYIIVDFSKADVAKYLEIQKELENLDISILVNNVGVGVTGKIEEIPLQFVIDVLNTNAFSTIMMTRILINKILNRPKKGAIITTSSALGSDPWLTFSLYSATKRFQLYFSESLRLNYPEIDFIVGQPLGVCTKMLKKFKSKNIASTEEYVLAMLSELRKGKSQTYGTTRHKQIVWFNSWDLTQKRRENRQKKVGLQLAQLG
ncbi:hypothetical protein pb186bvf_007505 [Paramecium bursaria]